MSDLYDSDVAGLNSLFGELLCWPEKYEKLKRPDSRRQFLTDRGLSGRCIEAIDRLDADAFASCDHLAAAVEKSLFLA